MLLAIWTTLNTILAPPASASGNVSAKGKWYVGKNKTAYVFSITNENLATGTCTAKANPSEESGKFIDCRVAGKILKLTYEFPGTVIKVDGALVDLVGTIAANTMVLSDVGLHEWVKSVPKYFEGGFRPLKYRLFQKVTLSRVSSLSVKSVSPSSGLVAGGSKITLSGIGFDGATAVDFVLASGATVPATSFSVVNDTTISAVTPSVKDRLGSTDHLVADVIVSVKSEKSSVGKGDQFTFVNLAITKLSSKAGLAQGAQSITVTGTGFIDVTGVDMVPADALATAPPVAVDIFHVNSPTSMTITTPSATSLIAPGAKKVLVDVVVSVGSEKSPTTSKDRYTYEYLQLTKVTPATGPLQGGTHVALFGQDFKQVTDVVVVYDPKKPGVPAPFSILSDKQIVLTTPDMRPYGAKGATSISTDIIVTVGNFATKAHTNDQFIFSHLAVTKVAPNLGPVNGATKVTLSGSGFTGATKVTLTSGSLSVIATPKVLSDTSLSFATPSIAKLVGLTSLVFKVSVAVGTTSSAPSATALFTYRAATG